jgi:hypothetical protein
MCLHNFAGQHVNRHTELKNITWIMLVIHLCFTCRGQRQDISIDFKTVYLISYRTGYDTTEISERI